MIRLSEGDSSPGRDWNCRIGRLCFAKNYAFSRNVCGLTASVRGIPLAECDEEVRLSVIVLEKLLVNEPSPLLKRFLHNIQRISVLLIF